MNMNKSEKDFVDIRFNYKKSIQKKISEEEWEALNHVLKERQSALEIFFSKLEFTSNKCKVIEMIKKIQIEDAGFLSLIQDQRMKMKKQLTDLKQGRKSIKAYQV